MSMRVGARKNDSLRTPPAGRCDRIWRFEPGLAMAKVKVKVKVSDVDGLSCCFGRCCERCETMRQLYVSARGREEGEGEVKVN
jgi:hypothetical protein